MPVGLRYHSVHHMFPRLPYHALGEAHRRLAAALPADHLYHKTLVPHFSGALANVLRAPTDGTQAQALESGPPCRGSERAPYAARYLSIASAALRPSAMAHTTSDWPRRMSPAAKTPGTDDM